MSKILVTTKLPPEFLKKLKRMALEEGKTMAQLTRELAKDEELPFKKNKKRRGGGFGFKW